MAQEDNQEQEQLELFEMKANPKEWEVEWQGMPEFIQEKRDPFHMLQIRFANEKDYWEFAKLIEQNITKKTLSIWYPKLQIGANAHLRYADES
tara:strand:- start:2628 stop:2906 length:279 start_codon:yes stop_codon:yes gene_type:complete